MERPGSSPTIRSEAPSLDGLPRTGERLPTGPATRERAARVLAQQLGAVWEGILEARGYDAGGGWRLEVGELYVVPGRGAD